MKLSRFGLLTALLVTAVALVLTFGVNVQAQSAYNVSAVKGKFGYSMDGVYGPGTIAGFGVMTADGIGGVSGVETVKSWGKSPIVRSFTGTYGVNPDGTGWMQLNYSDSDVDPTGLAPAASFQFVVVDQKRSLQAIQTDSGAIVSARFSLQ